MVPTKAIRTSTREGAFPLRSLGRFRVLLPLAWLIPASISFAQPCRYSYQIETMQANGHSISVEIYEPEGRHRHPLLLMIHGTAGVLTRTEPSVPREDNFGEKTFAEHCYVVALPHYFETLGRSSVTDPEEARRDFPEFRIVLQEVMSKASLLPDARNCPVLLYGESLGGYLAASIGFRDPRVLAVSEYGGGLPLRDMEPRNRSLSFLIQHGADDKLVPSSAALDLEQYARTQGATVQMYVYPGQGHYFDAATRKLVLGRTLAFFDEIVAERTPRCNSRRP